MWVGSNTDGGNLLQDMLVHRIDVKRPTYGDGSTGTEKVVGYTDVIDSLPACVQPVSAQMLTFYLQRGMQVSYTVYTTPGDYRFSDKLIYKGKALYVLGVRNLVELDEVVALDCSAYPSTAKAREN